MNAKKPYSGENHIYHCSSEKMGIENHRVMKKRKKEKRIEGGYRLLR
jgi:hypothetical protein